MKIPARLRRLAGVGSRFLVVGALSTVIEIALFNLLVFVVGWDPLVSKFAASLIALVNAYIGNREWAFRHRDRRGRVSELVLFLATNLVCTLLGVGIVWVGVETLNLIVGHATGPVALNVVNLISIVIVVLIRFVLYHKVVFRNPSAPPAGTAGP